MQLSAKETAAIMQIVQERTEFFLSPPQLDSFDRFLKKQLGKYIWEEEIDLWFTGAERVPGGIENLQLIKENKDTRIKGKKWKEQFGIQ